MHRRRARAVEGDHPGRDGRRESADHIVDLAPSRGEHQDIAGHSAGQLGGGIGDRGGPSFAHGTIAVFGFDGKDAAFDVHHGGVAQECCDRHRIDGGRHHDDAEIGTDGVPGLDRHGEAQITVQIPFVELVEDDGTDGGQFGVGLEAPREDRLGHDLDPAPSLPFTSHREADRPADRLTEEFGQTGRGGPGSQASGLQEHHAPGLRIDPSDRLVDRKRHEARLACSGSGRQHQRAGDDGVLDGGQHPADGKIRCRMLGPGIWHR